MESLKKGVQDRTNLLAACTHDLAMYLGDLLSDQPPHFPYQYDGQLTERSWKSAEGTGSHTCLKTLVRPLSYCISDDLGTIKRMNYSRGDLQPKCTCVCCAVLKHVPAKAAIFTLLCFSRASSIYQTQRDTIGIKDIADVQFPFRPSPYYAQQDNNFDEAERQINTTMMDDRSCYTAEGRFGSCMSFRSCYPTSELSYLQTWSVIMQIACSYTVKDGRQMHGICCPKHVTIIHSGLSNDIQIMPLVIMPYPAILYPLMVANVTLPLPAETTISPSSPLTEKQVAIESKQINCGVGPAKILSLEEDRIVGGADAVKNSWPYVVALKYSGRFFCGGSLISSNRVLTAAHCVDFFWPWDYLRLTVELGVHVLIPTSDALLSRRVFNVIRHRHYNPNTLEKDIAILNLKFPVSYVTAISPVCLPSPGTTDTYVDQEAAIIGWGSLNNQIGPLPDVLQQATVKIISNADCQASYNNLGVTIKDNMICAAAPGISSCFGDSGGPLLLQSSPTGPWTEVGIVSFGFEVCASPDYPVVYTRVSSFSSWISQRIV